MKRTKPLVLLGATTAAMLAVTVAAEAAIDFDFDFYGEDQGGAGSATMTFDIGDTNAQYLTVNLFNTSPTELLNGTPDANAPGITAFGFDLLPADLGNLLQWELKAFPENDPDGSGGIGPVTIGKDDNDCGAITCSWVMLLDEALNPTGQWQYYPSAGDPTQIKGALYNPDAAGTSALAADPNFFTQAALTLKFAESVTAVDGAVVRMQNVGNGGSLKLVGTPNGGGGGGQQVPEPATVALLLAGVAGLGARRRPRRRV